MLKYVSNLNDKTAINEPENPLYTPEDREIEEMLRQHEAQKQNIK